ncbi:polyketide synthase [Aspergillus affinis]|uniref:polyketide synthase n=1 Tax=Aspergillus affinis TaxID=1070780 RepID=UPI0022FE1D94|nr:polyketide synthase [Aspergillus affinis]KAI9038420.1 polyketide synthase [Aspergillus affinis]
MKLDLRPLSSGSELSDSATLASSQPSSVPSVATPLGGDAVAIVGLACRVAGASNPHQLWDNIIEQKDLRRLIPGDRFNVDAFYHPEGTNKGTTNARHGYFLDQDLRDFDSSFFNISGKEAAAMDPQQRLLLEVVYEALENAGIPIEDINGSQTSVYCGCFTNDYYSLTMRDLASYPKYTVTGTGNSILANRISYFYNLHGPSMTIDTACSSSIVALHMGLQSLKNEESDISIVVGSALHFLEDSFVIMTDLGMLSPDGQSRSFDADGRGYARGEGVCAVVLKRQEHAESQGDHIRALVRGSLVNHDGSKQGITLPSSEAQEALIRQTYKNAGLNPADTQYVEAHGTGTARGDPIEAQAIGAIFGKEDRLSPLYIGSVKSNIGHLEGASGLAGIIKATMALEHGEIPPNMNFDTPNPQIPFQEWKLEVPQRLLEWPSTHGPKRASVNSFGYGGTNGHVILEEYRPRSWTRPERSFLGMSPKRPLLLPLTSHSDAAGRLLIHRMTRYLHDRPNTDISDLARSLSTRRSMHACRTFAIFSPRVQLVQPWVDAVWKSLPPESMPRRLGFVFTGQGAQWWAMGRQLIEQSPLFRQRLEYCDEVLQALPHAPDWSVVTELLRTEKESRIAQETRLSQPICTALQISLVDLLASWNVRPSATVGHSSGEIAAAYAAGILSFSSSVIVAYYRGLHMSAASSSVKGGMMAANLTPEEARQEIHEYGGRVVIGAVNSSSNVTISGDADAIVDLKDRLTARSIFARVLAVTQAFHSPHMFPLAPAYEDALGSCPAFRVQPAVIRMFSSVTARVADTQKMGPSYWASNMTGTVRFADALVGTVLDEDRQNVDVLIEIGPHPAVKGPSRQVLQSLDLNIPYLASLTRQIPAYEAVLHTAGELFQLGYPVDLGAVNSDQFAGGHGHPVSMPRGSVLRDMPSHAWDHQPYWAETRMVKAQRDRPYRHVLLGSLVEPSIPSHPRWRNFLRLQELPWLRDHVIDGLVIFPAAGYIAMAVEAMVVSTPDSLSVTEIQLQDIAITAPLLLNDQEGGVEVMVELKPTHRSDTEWEFIIVSYTQDARSVEHCIGFIAGSRKPLSLDSVDFDALRRDLWGSTAATVLYQHLSTLGLQYGPAFQLLSGSVETGPKSALGSVVFPARQYTSHVAEHTILHPTLLDASFHLVFAALQSTLGRPLDQPYVPTTIRTLRLSRGFLLTGNHLEQQEFLVSATVRQPGPQATVHDLVIRGQGGITERRLHVEGLKCVSLGARSQMKDHRSLFFRNQWRPAFNMLRDGSTSFGSLPQLVDLFLHQYPNTRIAHLTNDLEQVKDFLALLGGGSERRRCQSITPVFPPGLCYSDELKQPRNSHLIDLREPDPESVDLVIISFSHDLPRSVQYARDGGYIITEKCVEPIGLIPLFTSQGYTVWRKRKGHTDIERRPLTIIMISQPSERTQDLAEAIRSHYGTAEVSFVTLDGSVETSSFHRDIVVLCSLDADRLLEDSQNFKAIQSLMTGPTPRRIMWVLQGGTIAPTKPQHAIIVGLTRAARSENASLRMLTIDITPDTSTEAILRLLDADMVPGEDEISERDGIFLIPRVYADDDLNSKLYNGVNSQPRLQQLDFDQPRRLVAGDSDHVDTLMFVEDEALLDDPVGAEELDIEVQASSLSSGDAALTLGTESDDASLGGAFAGVVCRTGARVDTLSTGDRVVAFRPGHSPHRTIVRSPVHLCHKVPDNLPLSDATIVALAGVPAYHAVVTLARLQPNQTILIHISSWPIKQMAVQFARRLQTRIIVTVQSQEEQKLLQGSFGMESSHILLSLGEEQLIQQVMQLTKGKGVNVVVHESLSAGIERCLVAFGLWVGLDSRATMPVKSNTTFSVVDMMVICQDQTDVASDLLHACLTLVQTGEVHSPVAIPHIPCRDLIEGFGMVQQHRHDTVILTADPENDLVPVRPPSYRSQRLLHLDKQYLLIGGLGGIGRTLAEWLVRRGAQELVFFSRSGMDRPEAQSTVALLRQRGVQVSVVQGDVASYSDVRRCIEALPRLAGIFHAAMVLRDGPLDTMTHEQWQQCLQPKVQGTMNLHEATKNIALDFFVCFSSVSAIIGTRGQANYCAGNAFVDALMAHRRLQGLPGSTMNCGMITGVGVVAENRTLQKDMERLGYDAVNVYELLCQVEEAVCNANAPETISGLNLARDDLYWATKPLLRNLYANHDWTAFSEGYEEEVPLVRVLHDTTDAATKTSTLLHAFMTAISKMLVIPLEQIQATKSLSSYGLDSLVAMEIRKWFSSTIEADLPLFEILSSPSIAHLVDRATALMPSIAQTRSTHAGPAEPLHESHTPEEPIGKADMSEPIPMTPYQVRMWLAHRSATSESSLNLAVVCRLRGSPDPSTIQRAFGHMKQRNAILRTGYRERDGFYEQFVTGDSSVDLDIRDCRGLADPEALLARTIAHCKSTPVNIAGGRVMQLTLVHLTEREHALICVVHHIAIDGGSTQPMLQQWTQIYNTLRNQRASVDIPAPSVSYSDFAVWHNTRIRRTLETDLVFWKECLDGIPLAHKLLPFAQCERPLTRDTARAYVHGGPIPPTLVQRMKRLCRETQVTPVDFLIAAFRAFIFRHTQDDDIIFLLVNGTRPHPAAEELVGCFVDMTPLRCHDPTCNDLTFDQLLTVTHQRSLQALSHGDVPFLEIVRALGLPPTRAHNPVGQIYVNYYMHGPTPTYQLSDCTISEVQVHDIPSASELSLAAMDHPQDGLRMSLQYATNLYQADDMQRFLDGLCHFICSAIRDHRQLIKEISMNKVGGEVLVRSSDDKSVSLPSPVVTLSARDLDTFPVSQQRTAPSRSWITVTLLLCFFILSSFVSFLYTSVTYLPVLAVCFLFMRVIAMPSDLTSPL